MPWLFPAKDKTQSGYVVQRKAGQVLTIDPRHYANQHGQNHLQSRTTTTDTHHWEGVQRTLRCIWRVLKFECDPMNWTVQPFNRFIMYKATIWCWGESKTLVWHLRWNIWSSLDCWPLERFQTHGERIPK